MKDVIFTVSRSLDEQGRDELLQRVQGLPGVSVTGPLKPGSRHADVRAVCYARVEDEASAASLAETLRSLPEVESAEVPATRKLP